MAFGAELVGLACQAAGSARKMEDTNKKWGSRGRRTSGNLKPRRLDEEKLAFLREAYEPDEEHLVAEALFDLANMFEEEEDAAEEEQGASFQQQHHHLASPPLNGKRTRKGLPATNQQHQQQQQQQQPKPMTRTYSQQRASPLPHNMVTHPAGAAAAAAAAANSVQQSLLLAQQQLHQQHPQHHQQQHPQHASAGQAAHASTHPQAAGLYPPQQYFSAAGSGGLQGTNPFFMPPYAHLQLPPGALSGKLATTLLPNGNPVPLAFGPNGTLVPLSGAWPQGLLHPQQRQQHSAALAQQLQPPLGLAAQAGGLPYGGATVTAGVGLPLGAAQVSLVQQQQRQQQQQQSVPAKVEEGLPTAGPSQGPEARGGSRTQQESKPAAPSAFANQEQQQQQQQPGAHEQPAATAGGTQPSCDRGAGSHAGLKRCALHVRIAHMIMEQQRQQGKGAPPQQQQPQQQPPPQQHSAQQPQEGGGAAEEGGPHRRGSSSPPSTEHNGSLVRQHSAGSTSTCPSAPSALAADTNTSPASTRAPHAPTAVPHARTQQAPPSSPGREGADTSQQAPAASKPPAAREQPPPASRPPQAPSQQAAPPPAPVLGDSSVGSSSLHQSYSPQQQQQQQQQQVFLQLQRLQQLQALAASSTSSPFPLGSYPQGLPVMGMSQPPLSLPSLATGLPGSTPHLSGTSFGFPAALLGLPGLSQQLPQHPQQHHLHHFPQNGAFGGGAIGLPQAAGVPPHLLAQVLGHPGLMNMGYLGAQHPQQQPQYQAPGVPAFSLPVGSSPAVPMQAQPPPPPQQQQQQQRPQVPAIRVVGGSVGTTNPQVH